MNEIKKCCICGKDFNEWGNNPWPFIGETCCNVCDLRYVIPARIMRLQENVLTKYHAQLLMAIQHGGDILSEDNVVVLKHIENMHNDYVFIVPPQTQDKNAIIGAYATRKGVAWAKKELKAQKQSQKGEKSHVKNKN